MQYDFIIAGGGLAGLSLACHMVRSPLRERSILIIDKDAQKRNDRTWGFWSNRPLLFDDIIYHSWEQLQVVGEGFERVLDLGDYVYNVIRGIDFYRFARQDLAAYDNVHFLSGKIEGIEDGRDVACVTVDGQKFYGTWVFDSLPVKTSVLESELESFHYLRMHFRGWEIETATPAFDPQVVTFLDFRVPQERDMQFFYILPFTERRALVEYTLFSKQVLNRSEYEDALRHYLKSTLNIDGYEILSEERGSVLITDNPLRREIGKRVMAIGAKAGRVKPSTGYAFVRIQEDSDEIVESLLLYGHPFAVPDDPDLYDILDAVMLQVMQQHGAHVKTAFTALFKRSPVEYILRFLDEESTLWENLMLVSSMPPQLFILAFFKVLSRQNIFDIMAG